MLFDFISVLRSGNIEELKEYLIILPVYLVVILFSLSVHEAAHAFAALKCGDDTAKNFGRLTLNPLKHLNPIGFICMLVAGFGWANPVPVYSRRLKNPHRDMAIVSLAGPASNLLVALLFVILYRILLAPINTLTGSAIANAMKGDMLLYYLALAIIQFFFMAIRVNITLAIFNLLPVPPLDGSKILFSFLPPKVYYKIAPYEQYISIAFMLLLVFDIITPFISKTSNFIFELLFKLVGIN